MMKIDILGNLFNKHSDDNRLSADITKLTEKILNRKISDIKIAAALICLKRHRNPKFYSKVLDKIKEYKEIDFECKESIEIGYPYKIKLHSPYFIIAASIVLSLLPKSDIKTVFHGESSDNLSSTNDVFEYLNISNLSKENSINMLKHLNISFFNRKTFLPKLSSISNIRKELNINDVFYYVEKFVNPVNSNYLITGVKNYDELKFYKELLNNKYKRFAIVIDKEGFPDITNSTTVFIYGDKEETVEIDIKDFDIEKPINTKFDIKKHTKFLEDLLSKKEKKAENLLFINGALLLYLKGKVNSLYEGFEITKDLFEKYDYYQILKNIQYYAYYQNYKNIYEF